MASASLDQPYQGGFTGREHRFALTVYYEDTDAAGLVYYANYLKFMERARSDMLRAAGVDQRAALEAGAGAYAVTEVNLRYRRPARLGDALIVISNVEAIRGSSLAIQQRVMRGTEDLVDGRVTVAFVSLDGRAIRQPRDWVARFNAIFADGA